MSRKKDFDLSPIVVIYIHVDFFWIQCPSFYACPLIRKRIFSPHSSRHQHHHHMLGWVGAKQFLSGTLNSAHLIWKIFSVDFLWTDGKGRFLFILLWTLSLSISGYNNFFIIPFSLSLFLLYLVVKKVSLRAVVRRARISNPFIDD